MDNLGDKIVPSLPSTNALGNLFAEYLGLVFSVDAFDRILGECQSCRRLNHLPERGLDAADHRRNKPSRAIATPVLTHALQLLVAVGRLKIQLFLNHLILAVALYILLFQAAICAVRLRSVLECPANLERVLIDRVLISNIGIYHIQIQNARLVMRVSNASRLVGKCVCNSWR